MLKNNYANKIISLDDAVGFIKSNDLVVVAPGSTEPLEVFDRLPNIADKVENITLSTMLSLRLHEIYKDPKIKGILNIESAFYSPPLRLSR